MEPALEPLPVPPSPAPALEAAPQGLLDAAYCGPEPDHTEMAALFARGGFPL